MIKNYHDLEIYQKSYGLALEMHRMTFNFPKHEMYELGSQLRRAAISIPLNIVEGYGQREYPNVFKKYLITALGSCNEVAVILDMVKDLDYLDDEKFEQFKERYDHLGRQINKLIHTWK